MKISQTIMMAVPFDIPMTTSSTTLSMKTKLLRMKLNETKALEGMGEDFTKEISKILPKGMTVDCETDVTTDSNSRKALFTIPLNISADDRISQDDFEIHLARAKEMAEIGLSGGSKLLTGVKNLENGLHGSKSINDAKG